MRLVRSTTIVGLSVALTLVFASPAAATAFNFDVTFNGLVASIDPTSDPIAGTTFVPGDTFSLDIHAADDDFWRVSSTLGTSFYATFLVANAGFRVGNTTTTLFLDGAQVAQGSQLALNQGFRHIGGQTFTFPAGDFDRLVLDYTLLSSTVSLTQILDTPDVVFFNPFFRNAQIAYVDQPATVPEPGTLLMLGAGLAMMLRYRRSTR